MGINVPEVCIAAASSGISSISFFGLQREERKCLNRLQKFKNFEDIDEFQFESLHFELNEVIDENVVNLYRKITE